MKKTLLSGILLFANYFLFAQHQDVFPELEGNQLIQNLVTTYKPQVVLPFGDARDTLFSQVYAENDTLTCVYSGHKLYLDPTQDPTIAAFQDGAIWGINTEHTWPRAFGADEGNPRADMHHLHPTRSPVNAARANLPFLEINDNQADKWFFQTEITSSIPADNVIDLYSEGTDNAFEPREDHKGNVARAMFYFYTMYLEEVNMANPDFFEIQRATFCEWHIQDPVDIEEWQRTWKIAEYQDGKPNPFVLDCTLPERSYCQDTGISCEPVILNTREVFPGSLQLFPNPSATTSTIRLELPEAYHVQVALFDSLGRELMHQYAGKRVSGVHDLTLDISGFPDGLMACRITLNSGLNSYSKTIHLIKE